MQFGLQAPPSKLGEILPIVTNIRCAGLRRGSKSGSDDWSYRELAETTAVLLCNHIDVGLPLWGYTNENHTHLSNILIARAYY